MRTVAAGLLLALATVGCNSVDAAKWDGEITDSAGVAITKNPAHGDWSLRAAPEVSEDLDIGTVEGEEAYQFGRVAAIDVTASGDILVLDAQAAQVRVFDPAGRHLRSIGKPGSGPGELTPMMVTAVLAGPGDTLYVADLGRQRLVALAGDGTEIASYPVRLDAGIPFRWQAAPGGRIAVQIRRMQLPGAIDTTQPMRDFIILRDPKGEIADTIADLPSGETLKFGANSMEMKIFSSEPIWTLLEDGRLVRGRNDEYRFEVFSADGRLERVITRPVERHPVTLEDQDAYKDMMRRLIPQQQPAATPQVVDMFLRSMSFAEHFPVYANFFGGPEGTLWVQRFPTSIQRLPEGGSVNLEDLSPPDWDVFDAEGRLLGMVTLPERFNPLRVVGSTIYGTRLDELDVQHVVRLNVRF